MKKILLIFIFIICVALKLQSNETKRTIQVSDSIIKILKTQIAIGNLNQNKLDSLNNDLRNQLIIYKAKEDYFAVALEDQSNRFALIITALLAFLGVISFSWYRIEKLKINRKFNSFNQEFEKLKKENEKLNSRLCATAGNAFSLIALKFREVKSFLFSFEYSIYAARENCKAEKQGDNNDFKVVITILKLALGDFNEVRKDATLKDELAKIKDSLLEDIQLIQSVDNNDVKDLSSEIRIAIKNYMK